MSRYAWLGWAVPVALVFILSIRQIGTADFWWQWATGRHILERGIPSLDPWLTTAEPRPWLEMRWIYCIGLYASVEKFGAWLPILIAAAMYAAGVGLALGAGNRAAPGWLAATGVLTALVIGRRLVVRPEVFTLFLLGVTLWVLVRMRQGRLNAKWGIPLLFVTQVLWANTHGLFLLGPALCGLWLVVEIATRGKAVRVALIATLVTVAASFINPYGVDGVAYPFLLLQELHVGAYRNNIIELRTPFAFAPSPSFFAHMLMAVAVAGLALRRKGDPVLLLACAATLYLSLTVVRNAPLFALTAAAFVSTCELRPRRALMWAAVGGSVAIVYSFVIGTWTVEDRFGLHIDRGRYALQAAESLQHEDGEVFNTLVEGGLLIALGKSAYCDPRLEVLPQERFLDMLDYSRLKKPLPEHFDVLLLTLDSPLAAKIVMDSQGWRVEGIDAVGIALVRDPSAVIDREEVIRAAKSSVDLDPPKFSLLRTARSPIPYRRLAVFLQNIGATDDAQQMRDLAKAVYP